MIKVNVSHPNVVGHYWEDEFETPEQAIAFINKACEDIEAAQQPLAPDVLPCGHPKSSLVQLRFGSLPYCEDCKRQNAGKA